LLILHHLDARHIRTELLIEATENTRNGTGSRSSHKVDQRHEGNYAAVAAMNVSLTVRWAQVRFGVTTDKTHSEQNGSADPPNRT
jgi:hypothetical protein